ncbi:MAG TPA: class I SAM-dependent methyltransferase [Methylomirabilota bacterium]|jgi:tellurite methyltransferase
MPGTATRQPWSPWAREYARDPQRYVFGTVPSDWARAIARLVRPGDAVLDLGCGEGRDSVFFAELGARVTGVDLAADGLDKARRLARRRGVRIRWIEGGMTDALPAGPFDLIFSCGTIHYVTGAERRPLFRRLAALTRPGGYQAHVVFTDRVVHEEKGEIVDYFTAGELREAFVEWQVLRHGERVISCAQDGSVHGHSVDELVAARPVVPAPRPSDP